MTLNILLAVLNIALLVWNLLHGDGSALNMVAIIAAAFAVGWCLAMAAAIWTIRRP